MFGMMSVYIHHMEVKNSSFEFVCEHINHAMDHRHLHCDHDATGVCDLEIIFQLLINVDSRKSTLFVQSVLENDSK